MPRKPRRSRNKKKKQDVVELAQQVLKQEGQPLQLQELIERVSELMEKTLDGKLSHYHTELNMDRRFVYAGKGLWGLREWLPKEQRVRPKAASGISEDDYEPSLEDYMWDEDTEEDPEEDESELLIPANEEDELTSVTDDFDREVHDEDEDYDAGLEEEFDLDVDFVDEDLDVELDDEDLDEELDVDDEDPDEEEEDETPLGR